MDYVPDVVHAMNEQYGEYGSQLVAGAEGSAGRRGRQHSGAVRWLVGDLTAMAWAGNGEYDLVVDKVGNAKRSWALKGGGSPGERAPASCLGQAAAPLVQELYL